MGAAILGSALPLLGLEFKLLSLGILLVVLARLLRRMDTTAPRPSPRLGEASG